MRGIVGFGDDLRFFAGTLYEANRLDELKVLLEHVASADPTAEWVVPMLLEIALRAIDPDAAVVQLRTLVTRNHAGATEARIEVARLLAEADRKADAFEEVTAALETKSIAPARP